MRGEVRCTKDRLLQFTFLTRRMRLVLIYAVIICRRDSYRLSMRQGA